MEVRIIITDSAAGSSAPASDTTVAYGAAAAPAEPPEAAPAASSAGPTPPADILRAARATGALDAGPAPMLLGQGGSGAPPAFVSTAAAEVGSAVLPTSPAPALPAGAAPGTGLEEETFEAEDPGDDEE